MPQFQLGAMGRIGSLAVLVLLIGLAQFCQGLRDQKLPGSGLKESTRTSTSSETAVGGGSSTVTSSDGNKQGSSVEKVSTKGALQTDEALDDADAIKFESLRTNEKEGVLDAPSPSPSSAFSVLPSIMAPALALAVSFAVLAAKTL